MKAEKSAKSLKRLPAALLTLFALFSGTTFAHDTVSSGAVSVTMLTDAQDLLRAGAGTAVVLDMKLKDKQLAVRGCRCLLLVYRGEASARVAPLAVIPLMALPDGRAGALVNVPSPGQYTLMLDGRPVRPGSFDSFQVRYRVLAVNFKQ